jgi:hypothetical protein
VRTSGAVKFVSSVFRSPRARGGRTLRRNGECAYGKTVWSWPSLLRSSFRGGVCEPNRADSIIQFARRGRPEGTRLPGEHGISRPTIAQGRPSDWLHLYAAVRFSCVCFCAADRGCEVSTRPSLRPLGQGGRSDQAKLGRNAPRVREGVSTIQDASWKSGATASYSVIASAAKQSSLPPRRDSGLLRSARKDALRECAPHATLASPVRSAEAFAARRGHARGG